MKVAYKKKFLKDLAKLPKPIRERIEVFVFQTAPECNHVGQMGSLQSLTGYRDYYKVRFGNYRVGCQLINDTLEFRRVMDRKDIYRYFP